MRPDRFVALFLLGLLALNPPLLSIFDTPSTVAGLPVLYIYLFLAWGALILLVGLAVGRSGGSTPPPRGPVARDPRPDS